MVCKGESVRSSWAPSKVSLAGITMEYHGYPFCRSPSAGDLLGALGHLGGFFQPKRMVNECGPQPLSTSPCQPGCLGCDFGISSPCQFVIHTQAYIVQSIHQSLTFNDINDIHESYDHNSSFPADTHFNALPFG